MTRPSQMQIRPLQTRHLEDLLALETEYPPDYRLGREVLAAKLENLESCGYSLSWIIHVDGACVAYIVVYPQYSRLEGRAKEPVIYVDDVYVQKGFEVCLFRLIQHFTRQASEMGMRHFPIEGVCRVGAYRAFASHDSLLRRLGWELAKKSEYWDSHVEEEMCWLRWEPLVEQGQSSPGKDLVSVSQEASDGSGQVPHARLVTFEQSQRYAYRPSVLPEGYVLPGEEEQDEFSALTEVMLGKGDDDLVEIMAAPPVDRASLRDVFGIQKFFGTAPPRGRARILGSVSSG